MKRGLIGIGIIALVMALWGVYSIVGMNDASKPKIGVVRLQDAVEQHPNFKAYQEQKEELQRMEEQRFEEGSRLDAAVVKESEKATDQLAMLEMQLTDSLNTELQSKVALKEAELRQDIAKRQVELIRYYRSQLKVESHPVDIEIVNLQLALSAIARITPIDDAQRARLEEDRRAKEGRLQELLQERTTSIDGNVQRGDIHQRVEAELAPMYESMQNELEAYAESLAKELANRRDTSMKSMVASQQQAVQQVHAEGAQLWNTEWDKRLEAKRDEVKALHDAILEDIRMRASVLAQTKKLDLVVVDFVVNLDGTDITDEMIQSYGK